jgi:hypothetical protein
MRDITRLIGAAAIALSALASLAWVQNRLFDLGAEALVVLSLLTLVHAAFRLVDESGRDETVDEESDSPRPDRGA